MLPLIKKEINERLNFVTSEELLDIISISECTPGPISINCATFIGYKVCGFLGALISTIGVILPSFFIILIISIFITTLKNVFLINEILTGVKIGVIVLLISSVSKLSTKSKKTNSYYIVLSLVLLLTLTTKISSITILFSSILIYFLIFKLKQKGWQILDNILNLVFYIF